MSCFSRLIIVLLVIETVVGTERCSTWFFFNNNTKECQCGGLKPWGVRCNQQEMKVKVANGYCVTYSDNTVYAGDCNYVHMGNFTDRMFSVMPSDPRKLNKVMCGLYNRRGFLCGECIDGYGPAIYSFDGRCTDCSEQSPVVSAVLYILLEFIPIAIFFILVVVFRINITDGPLLGYVYFCQLYVLSSRTKNSYILSSIISNQSYPVRVLIYGTFALCGVWSLQFSQVFLPNFCLSSRLTGVQVTLLELVPPAIIITIMTLTSVCIDLHSRNFRPIVTIWKVFGRCLRGHHVDGTAVIHAFATFIFLSVYNLNYISIVLVTHNYVSESNGSFYKAVLESDPNIEWFSQTHLAYLSVIGVCLLVLIILPALLLCVYPTRIYHYLSRFISSRKQLAIKTFAEALHFCFKDGLNGTHDYRSLAGFSLMYNIIFSIFAFYIFKLTETGYDFDFFSGLMLVGIAHIFPYVRLSKYLMTDLSLGFHTLILGILAMAISLWKRALSFNTAILEWIFIILPLVCHAFVFSWAGYMIVRKIRQRRLYSSSLSLTVRHFF